MKSFFLIVFFTILSGLGDSQAFLHSARIWSNGKLIGKEIGFASFGFLVGAIMYWIAIKFMQDIQINAPELQTLLWFIITIIGVAIFSGKFLEWDNINKIISVIVLLCLCILIYRENL